MRPFIVVALFGATVDAAIWAVTGDWLTALNTGCAMAFLMALGMLALTLYYDHTDRRDHEET